MKIKVKNITKIYDSKLPIELKALDLVSTEINQGEFIAIIGQTGSGKTTFIQHMNALLLPDSGEIEYFFVDKENKKVEIVVQKPTFFNRKIKKVKEIRRRVGVVFQFAEYQLFEQTIEKDIIFGALSMGVEKQEALKRAREMIELVGLDVSYLQRSPFELSGGQKRRVAIAGILAMDPDIIFFDEPTAGLDPEGTIKMLKILEKLNQQGKTIVLATHDLDNVLQWTKRSLFFKEGKLIYDGDTYKILSNNKFLVENKMMPTNLLNFVEKLKNIGYDVGKVKSLEELGAKINLIIKENNAN
ncbi:ABC transporter ATP-binding protein [Mesomycoplasma conjunctivae]|uniref:Cobalt import ATP-binding protein cbiO 2 n=1 Tax=Mesomycoplasma conjunctivae (strain ATCC 25834 / NCTC 10147 / HRC/581) TaxID=572263 RepID=C5J6R0_MESCH|nr:ATP-binding cassette domain-containing protein [Mesomycoplasma conjunctivae]CAT05170.1 Cobalt import ATP-binding protein cbiO 2 [Mesomycoplasma conjunctivae]VEU66178.1 ABC transporter ATP-binding protein [Mesomycoplasma conjunctivae]